MAVKSEFSAAAHLADDDQPLFGRSMQLGDRLYTFVMVRFLVVPAMVLGGVFAVYGVGIRGLRLDLLLLLAAVLLLCNTVAYYVVRPFHGNYERSNARRGLLISLMNITIAIDFACLTVAIWLVGGVQSPFQAFFIFHVIISAILLSPRAAFACMAFGYLLLAGLALGTWGGWIPAHFPEGAVPLPGQTLPDGRYVLTVLVVQGMLFLLTSLLLYSLMHLLRNGARQLRENNLELDRLSRQRRDFLHLALHNLRSPIGAASMLMSSLSGGYAGPLNEQQASCVARSQNRLQELTAFLRDLESLALLESGELSASMQRVDVRAMIERVLEEQRDLAQDRRHTLVTDIAEDLRDVRGMPRLIQEAMTNFVTNAIKYTPEGGQITVRAANRAAFVRIEVEDTGVGIRQEDLPRLFQEFVRVHTTHAIMSRMPGSGLGLVIVRRIAESHGGRVDVRSTPDQGSVFSIEIPAVL